jgi:hypothetical protein
MSVVNPHRPHVSVVTFVLGCMLSACGSVSLVKSDGGSTGTAGTGGSGGAGATTGTAGAAGGSAGHAGTSGQGGHGGSGTAGQGGASGVGGTGGQGGAAGAGGSPVLDFCNTDADCEYRPGSCCDGTCAAKTDPLPSSGPMCNIVCPAVVPSCSCVNHQCAVAACGSTDAGCTPGDAGTGGPVCPLKVPLTGDVCAGSMFCEYSSDATHACTTHADCEATATSAKFHWTVTPPPTTCGTHAAPCPDTFASLADGSACPGSSSLTCDYALGRCGCLPCVKGTTTGSEWACRLWDSGGTGCPVVSPLVGDACATPNLTCIYGGCGISVGDNVECVGGTWQTAAIAIDCAVRICPAGI